ncbi:phospholipid carrier-dependent glycosyltransferase [Jiangella gansuensis]|uniref:phospholipid carrier-dependent glycosyltransferase n=1 Tax=Jiangella gansuensis TaxID=281473 RepID=UPI00146FADFA|nr:phospholipid carrier-dependent glycosyltransferase [Jiangella gansuensis]
MRRAVPAVVWLIVVVHLAVALAQTAVFPNARSPDERQQVDLVLQVAQGEAWPWPDPGTAFITEGVEAGYFVPVDRLPGRQHLADRDDVPARGERPSYADAGGGDPLDEPSHNQLIQHPPLYYLLGAGVVTAVPNWADQPLDIVWMLLRWGNALLTAALPILLFLTATRLRLPAPLPVAAAATPLVVPELTHIDSSVNNDNLLIVLAAVATYLVARVLTGDLRWRTGAALGVVTSLALLTKGFALLMPAWIVLAYAVAAVREQRAADAVRCLLVAGAASVPGALWWLRNRLVHGTIQPHGTHAEPPDLTPVYGWSDGGWDWLTRFVERFVTLFFVNDHDSDRSMDASWWMARVALMVILVGIGAALVRRSIPRSAALVLLFPIPALAGIVARGSWEQFAAFGDVGAAQQGRYLFPGVVGLMVVAVAGASTLVPGWRRWLLPGVLALAVVIHAAFWHDVWALYWLPADLGAGSLGGVARAVEAIAFWYPFPPVVLGVVLVAGLAAAGLLARWAIREALASPAVPQRMKEPVA